MPLDVLTHDACREHAVPDGSEVRGGHPERPERLDAVRSGLSALHGAREIDAEPVERSVLTRVHSPEQVRTVERACDEGDFLDVDTYARPESWEAACRAVGGAIEAARRARDGTPAFAAVRPPGHHATPTDAMGFCLFNNVALAAEALAREGNEVAIVDIDVHHGNGTQEVFRERDDVLYVSLHQSPFYPGTGHAHEIGVEAGEGYTVNLPVPSGTGHAGWLELVERVVVPVLRSFDPDVTLVSAGFDAHRDDPVGGLDLVAGSFHATVDQIRTASPNVAAILEGGYSLEALERSAHATGAALVGEGDPIKETLVEGVRPWGMLRSPLASHVAPHWPIDIDDSEARDGGNLAR